MNSTPPTQDDLRALIPEYVNGRLADEQRAQVQRAAREDAAIAAQIEVFQSLRRALQEGSAPTETDELAWRRLQRALPAQEPRPLPAQEEPATASERSSSPLWRAAAAILAMVVIGQGLLLTAPSQDRFATAGAPVSYAGEHRVQVIFQANASAQAIRELLMAVEGNVVDGPSALGVYVVAFTSAPAQRAALATLAERRDVVATATLP